MGYQPCCLVLNRIFAAKMYFYVNGKYFLNFNANLNNVCRVKCLLLQSYEFNFISLQIRWFFKHYNLYHGKLGIFTDVLFFGMFLGVRLGVGKYSDRNFSHFIELNFLLLSYLFNYNDNIDCYLFIQGKFNSRTSFGSKFSCFSNLFMN